MSRSFTWVARQVDPIAIDFGSRFVRVLQLARQRGQAMITAAAQRILPPGPHTPEHLETLQSQAVREMLATRIFIGRHAVCSVAWDDLQVRTLRIPPLAEQDTEQLVRREAPALFGLPAANAEFRHLVAGDVRHGTELRQELIVIAATHQALDARIRLLQSLRLIPASLDAGLCAVFRGFERLLRRNEDCAAVSALVDLGYNATRLVVSRGVDPIFFRSIPVGGRTFDEYVTEHLDLSPAEASDLRVRLHQQDIAALTGQPARPDGTVGETTRRAVLDALREPAAQIASEITMALQHCAATFRGLHASEVTVVGGEAMNTDVLRLLSDRVRIPFSAGRPMRNVACDCDFDGADRRTGQPEWATALGLALKPVGTGMEVAA